MIYDESVSTRITTEAPPICRDNRQSYLFLVLGGRRQRHSSLPLVRPESKKSEWAVDVDGVAIAMLLACLDLENVSVLANLIKRQVDCFQ